MKYVTLSNILIAGLIAIIVVMGIRSCSDKPEHVTIIKPALVPTVQKTDKKGTSYTEIKGTLYTQAQMKALSDSLRRVMGKGKVQSVVETVTDIDVQLKHDTLYVDPSTGLIWVADSGKDIQITYLGNYKEDTGSFHVRLTPDTATRVTTFKTPLIGRPTMTVNEYHTNKLFTPVAGSAYSAKAPKTLLVIGPSGGGGWSTGASGIQGFVGVTATIPVISIRTK